LRWINLWIYQRGISKLISLSEGGIKLVYYPLVLLGCVMVILAWAVRLKDYRKLWFVPVLVVVLFLASGFLTFASSPVYQWAEYGYNGKGEVVIFYECASPTWWDRWMGSSEWQDWIVWKESVWGTSDPQGATFIPPP